eukprot:2561793-Amphidinium_carterae.2
MSLRFQAVESSDVLSKQLGVFAAVADKDAVVFRAGDIVGPLGGVLRRKTCYEKFRFGGHAETSLQGLHSNAWGSVAHSPHVSNLDQATYHCRTHMYASSS